MTASDCPIEPIPKVWDVMPLSKLTTKIGSGATPRGGEEAYLERRENHVLIRSQNVFDRHFDDEGIAFISDSDAAKLKGVELQPNDVLLNITGDGITFARAASVPEAILPAVVNQHVCIIRCDSSKCVPGYVLSYLNHKSVKHYMESFNAGGSRRALTKGNIENFLVPVPPLNEQQDIARILSSLDEKIELNRKQNRTLEAIAQALFKHWFVDFEFPDENGRPYKSTGGAMQPSEREGADYIPLADVIQVNPRTGLSKGSEATFADMKALPSSGMSVTGVIQKTFTGGGAKFLQSDTLLARITPCLENGKTAYVDFLGSEEAGFGSTEFIVLRATKEVCPEYVYCLARDPYFRQFAIRSMVGSSGRQRVQVDQIKNYAASIAPQHVMKKFQSATTPIFDKISANRQQIATLAQIRDTLLPKLMSGELRVA